VIDGSQASFTAEFPRLAAGGVRWFALSVVPWAGATRGAVVSQTDITQRRTAELEAQSSRHELAHLLRVSTVGVMATSLAHELNQPLTSILANAQAARRLAYDKPADIVELREILTDVIEQDKRAGEVIGRLREMLRKGEIRREPLDLNTVVQDVARLLASDAVIRNVALRIEAEVRVPRVIGDPTQIQQVVLNLLLNAMDACESGRARTVTVAVRAEGGAGVEVSVSDAGVRHSGRLRGEALRAVLHYQAGRAWAWGFPSPARSSPPTGAGSGPRAIPAAARPFVSCFPPRPAPTPRPRAWLLLVQIAGFRTSLW
jgi:signal transduction histidine kinase